MLELKNVKKDYCAGELKVNALKGIDLQFRHSEFVSVLGPSGCGKTTMLNIIGGLDKYTEGDLIINGKSTKDFHARDWDAYRNHSIGFVFQSYNLIPHQSVLQNVELALTLSGVSKHERRKRAKEALERVGLGGQFNKKPSEMSGGQMQRVAIARAIVNNPDIILADEPTGALDTETSVSVMEILKEISRDRLVIMVTHNPELAEKYSTRIIRMLDGVITDDSLPLGEEELVKEKELQKEKNEKEKSAKKPSMSFATSFGLSLKNLFTKKGRTALTSFAGSIGIIGIALIFAVSQGMTNYINVLQEDTLSAYPLTLEAQHMDMGSLLQTFIGKAQTSGEHENDAVYQKSMLYDLINSLNSMDVAENDLKSFKQYIETNCSAESENKLKDAVSGVQYTYDLDMLVYTENVDGDIIKSDSMELVQQLLIEYMGMDFSSMFNMSESYGFSSSLMTSPMGSFTLWEQMLPGNNGESVNDLLKKQYEIVDEGGRWPEAYNEIVLVLDERNELDDMTLYALGLKPKSEIDDLFNAAANKTEIEVPSKSWSYDEIKNMEFKVILNSDCYSYDNDTGTYTDMRDTQTKLKYLYNEKGINLKVVGIVRPSETAVSTMLSGSIAYTYKLTEYIINAADNSEAIKAQKNDPSVDIFTGLPFKENTGELTNAEKKNEFLSFAEKLNETEKAETYAKMMCIPPEEMLVQQVEQILGSMSRDDMEKTLIDTLVNEMKLEREQIEQYVSSLGDSEIKEMFEQGIREKVKEQYAQTMAEQLSQLTQSQLAAAFSTMISENKISEEMFGTYYDEILEFSESTYDDNLLALGCVSLDNPATINIYASTFENKDIIEDAITAYNEGKPETSQIKYTDYVGLMMSSVTSIINAITYVLVSFVAVSLIVSSIMIGVITLISVQERTKEIGILRAIGASKKNVSGMFNAETVIIGFTSGSLGVIITYLLCIPINLILNHLTGIENLKAYLPPHVAIILVVISVLLTLFAGIIPSRSASKKDPVVALRTE